MKKILISVLSVGIIGAVAIAATGAFFSDEEKSTGNTFQAGKLDLLVDYKSSYNGQPSTHWELKDLVGEKFFDLADVKPGDEGQGNISLHVDNNDAWACVTVTPTANDDVSSTEPELAVAGEVADVPADLFDGELAQNMFFTIFADVCNAGGGLVPGDNVYSPGCDKLLYQGQPLTTPITLALADSAHNAFTGVAGPLTGGGTYYIGSYWKVDKSIGNIIQTDKYTADISFYTEQHRNNPNFKCSSSEVVYNSIPTPAPGNFPSQAFEATSTSEFGGQITLTGTKRSDPVVTVMMSSWGCETGHWNTGDCVTTPGHTFPEPITLNIYGVGAGNVPGSLLATKTDTFNIPYRPSASVSCTGGDNGKWFDGTTCNNGFATPINFNLSGITLPDNIIVSVAYNTSHYGYAPIGEATPCYGVGGGCGYDSLNVAVKSLPSVVYPLPADAYLYSSWSGAYCDNGVSGINTFRLDAGCWTGYQPVLKIDAI